MEGLGGVPSIIQLANACPGTRAAIIVACFSRDSAGKALVALDSEGSLVGEYAPAEQQENKR